MLVATSVWLFSLPVLVANLIYAYVDLQGRTPISFGDPDRIWASINWAWSQPQIYAYAIPVLGVLGEIVPVSAKHRQANRDVVLTLIGLFGALSFGAWAQHALSRGADAAFEDGNYIYDEFLYVGFGVVIILPVLGVLGGAADTLRRGSLPKLTGALIGALAGALMLLGAVVAGALRVIPLWDALHEDNVLLSSATAQLTMVLAARHRLVDWCTDLLVTEDLRWIRHGIPSRWSPRWPSSVVVFSPESPTWFRRSSANPTSALLLPRRAPSRP